MIGLSFIDTNDSSLFKLSTNMAKYDDIAPKYADNATIFVSMHLFLSSNFCKSSNLTFKLFNSFNNGINSGNDC